MKKFYFLLTLLCSISIISSAQQTGTIEGAIFDPDQEAVSYANVLLLSATDSSMVKAEVSQDDGTFQFVKINAGNYLLQISYVGFPTYTSEIFGLQPDQKKTLARIQLSTPSTDLQEVVVKARKPVVEVKPDKMVFNVEGSINASGSTAFELLRKAPGVVVDNNDNVSLLGRSGVMIYIDGRPSPLSITDLAAYLKTLQSSEIESIEIITNPSAKFEAEGNAGIINIKLKKDKRLGTNATLSLGASQGIKSRYDGNLGLNYRDKKVNLFGRYGYYDGEGYNQFNLYRVQFNQVFDQSSENNNAWNGHNVKAGADFFLNEKNTIGFLVDGNFNEHEGSQESRTSIFMKNIGGVDSLLIAQNNNIGSRDNMNFNFNYRFDNNDGVIWNMDADYGLFRNRSEAFQPNTYTDYTGENILNRRNYRNNTPTDIDIWTFKVDHERPLLGGNLGIGGKFAYVLTDNTFQFYNVLNDIDILDPDRSNNFVYHENVNALYTTYNKQLKKWSIQAGLRIEQTNSKGELTSEKDAATETVTRHYTDVFPSGGITYQVNQKNSLQLTYSRRINRPNYQDLNPFENKLDELTFEKGNPFLQPEYANNIQLTHTFNHRFNTTLSYSKTKDQITRITDTSGTQASFITWLNLAKQENYSLNFSAPITFNEWWSGFFNLSGYHLINEADYGEGKVVDLNTTAYNIYAQQTFQLPWALALEISGWYASPAIWGGTFETEDNWSIDLGVQKKLWDGKGNLKVSVSDIFRTTPWAATSEFGELFLAASGNWDSRRVSVNFTYLFGNDQLKSSRRRKTGLEDEQKRVKSGN